MNCMIEHIEPVLDAIEPGSPVHDAGWNFLNTVKRTQDITKPDLVDKMSYSVLSLLVTASQLKDEQLIMKEGEISHLIMGCCRALTS